MKAEERLPIMRLRFDAAHEECEDIVVRSEYDDMTALAREAIALLRGVQSAGYEHPIECETGCVCEWATLGVQINRWLDGEG